MDEMRTPTDQLGIDKRRQWVMDVSNLTYAIQKVSGLPIPQLMNGSTFTALIIDRNAMNAAEFRNTLAGITRQLPGAVQEHYVWTTDPETTQPESYRVRLIWMFGSVRYEIDAAENEVFDGEEIGPISDHVTYLGHNVNKMHVPDSRRD